MEQLRKKKLMTSQYCFIDLLKNKTLHSSFYAKVIINFPNICRNAEEIFNCRIYENISVHIKT